MTTASEMIIAELLELRTGQQLTKTRSWRIGAALSGILREYGMSNIDQLVCLFEQPEYSTLSQKVVEALLNNETYFFRDRTMFDQLANRVLPELAEQRANEKTLSILCAGCSTGQEALSLAMIILEQEANWVGWKIKITGIDISHQAIAAAKAATYSQFEIQRGLSVLQMLTHFNKTPAGWQAKKALRHMTEFRVHNLLEPMPHTGPFDLVLSRNILLYFDLITRRHAFNRLIEHLHPNGWIMLGAGEVTTGHTDKLELVKDGMALYRPIATQPTTKAIKFG